MIHTKTVADQKFAHSLHCVIVEVLIREDKETNCKTQLHNTSFPSQGTTEGKLQLQRRSVKCLVLQEA
jgi:hypothetical protein